MTERQAKDVIDLLKRLLKATESISSEVGWIRSDLSMLTLRVSSLEDAAERISPAPRP